MSTHIYREPFPCDTSCEHPDPRDARIASLEAEVARLEALILQINDDLGRTWDTGLVDAEALRIRSRVP